MFKNVSIGRLSGEQILTQYRKTDYNFQGKNILDFGSGLSQVPAKLVASGALNVFAYDFMYESVEEIVSSKERCYSQVLLVLSSFIQDVHSLFPNGLQNITENQLEDIISRNFIIEPEAGMLRRGYHQTQSVKNFKLDISGVHRMNSLQDISKRKIDVILSSFVFSNLDEKEQGEAMQFLQKEFAGTSIFICDIIGHIKGAISHIDHQILSPMLIKGEL